MGFNYIPTKNISAFSAPDWDQSGQINDSSLGVDPRALTTVKKTGAKDFKPATGETTPADLADAASLGLGKSKTLRNLDRAVNGPSASQRAKDISEFLANKSKQEAESATIAAVPNPLFQRADRDWAGDKTPKYSAQAKMGIPGSFEPVNFLKARAASAALLKAAGLGAVWNAPISDKQTPTGGIDDARIAC